ncbi:MAG: transcriptional repressor LexA [Planctomycetota bacterium]
MGRTPAGQTRERIYRFMRMRLLEGRPPTVREVQGRFLFKAVQTAREHLERLVSDGRLKKVAGARGYRMPGSESGLVTTMVPVLGRVQAGPSHTAVEDLEGYVPVESKTNRSSEEGLFGLRVRGDSMRDAGILENDLVLVHRQETARHGDIVVALVGDEATVKRFQKKGRRIELHPANPDYETIVPDPEEFHLLGKVIEVRRYL